jgi:hypothetical protein
MARTYEIHPTIGIARLGPSTNFFFGPEPDEVFPPPVTIPAGGKPQSMRDGGGNLRPQAARFRVFEVERSGSTLTSAREVTTAEAEVVWQVHVVNRKAAAPRFAVANVRNHNPAARRNGAKNTDDLSDPTNLPLIINPGKVAVGNTAGLPTSANLVGSFKGTVVQLGQIWLEAGTGRLIFVGGKGTSDTVPPGLSLSAASGDFADNDNWFDDTADGTVEATIRFKADGRVETARPAWVVSGAYDFAPEVTNLVTIYDILFEMAVDNGLRALPTTIYYDQHIRPLLARLSDYQWVNRRANNAHGTGKAQDFLSDADLGTPMSPAGSFRRQFIFPHLREPGTANAHATPEMPLLFSDDFPNDASVLWLTKVQYAMLKRWANDDFVATAPAPPPDELLPDRLTRMQLESCVGRAFWPGIEISIRIYDPSIFFSDDPFRIEVPGAIQPGMLTQSMSLPWQSDFLACAGEPNVAGTGILYWWPAQRPNEVLPFGSTTPLMRAWAAGITDGDDMTKRWHMLGVVRKTGPGDAQREIERAL